MRVFGWYTDKDAPGYYRIQMPLTVLKQHMGWEVTAGKKLNRSMIDNYDVIIGQRVMQPGASTLWEAACKSDSVFAVYEIDDDLFHLSGNHDQEIHSYMAEHIPWVERNLRMADRVVCTTPALANVMSAYNQNIRIVPNYIDEALLTLPRAEPADEWHDDHTVVGWQGSNTHGSDFAEAWPSVKRLLGKYPHTQLTTMGANYAGILPRGRELQHHHVPWIQSDWETYYRSVAHFDIGIAPLRDNPFNRSKSWLKVLEYMALGVVPVATALPEYVKLLLPVPMLLIEPGQDHRWYSTLRDLVQDPGTLASLSRDVRMEAARYTVQGHIEEWAEALTPDASTTGGTE